MLWLIWVHAQLLSCPSWSRVPPSQVDAVSTDGATPLFNSCSSGSVACVRVLLQHGATLNAPSLLASPIHEAAKQGVWHVKCTCVKVWGVCVWCSRSAVLPPSGHTECLDLLLSWGAHTDVELPAVGTPLYSACVARAADCVMSLLHSGIRLIKNRDNQFGFKNVMLLKSLSHDYNYYNEDPHFN